MSNHSSSLARTPEPPYYAVIFSSRRSEGEHGYGAMAERMLQLAAQQPGFLGVESVRDASGFGITVSYWATEEAISAWKANMEHQAAQRGGKQLWYANYELRIARVERAYGKNEGATRRRQFAVKVDDLQGSEIAALLCEHLRSLSEVSPPESMHALNLEQLRRPDITFWSVWDGANLAGCGALKEIEAGHGEIKSMRTVRDYLRKGVGSLVLDTIIAEAKQRGYRRLSLETGSGAEFIPAHALYQKFGFSDCSPFGEYREDPNSRFMMLDLGHQAQ